MNKYKAHITTGMIFLSLMALAIGGCKSGDSADSSGASTTPGGSAGATAAAPPEVQAAAAKDIEKARANTAKTAADASAQMKAMREHGMR